METVARMAVVYVVLLALIRLSGRRTLAQTSPFDLVVLLVISETVQESLVGEDSSLATAGLLVVTLLSLDVAATLVRRRWRALDALMEGKPVILVERGRPLRERMDRARIDDADVLEAARLSHGVERMADVHRATLERSGRISVTPAWSPGAGG